jgi:hypothetical protein
VRSSLSAFIAADQEGFRSILAEAVAEHRPLAIVYPDGREIVAAPRSGALAFFEHLPTCRRGVKRGQPAVPLPADYQVETRDRQLAAAHDLIDRQVVSERISDII